MSEHPPVVYILHGEDELAITQYIAELQAKLGDRALADMNTIRLDGRSASFEDLETAANTPPFLAERRLVVLSYPKARLASASNQGKFRTLLDRVPVSVALVLVEYNPLTDAREKRSKKLFWLEEYGTNGGKRVLMKAFPLPVGAAMEQRIHLLAKQAGGQIAPPAVELLASLVGDNPRIADQEIHKLLAYVNYNRPIQAEDVEHLTEDQGHGDIFAMVDAIGNRDSRKAINLLHRLLEDQEVGSIFSMVVRQFRMILLSKEMLERGIQTADIARNLKTPNFVAEKITGQARKFTMPALEAIYNGLLDIDEGIKTGEMEGPLALDTFIARITH
ncbi:MAG: DNA polymerase III subunit delta [Omnitrophica WOR_2 bacterium]